MVVRKFCGVCCQLRLRIEEIKFTSIVSRFLGRINKIKAVLGSPFKSFIFLKKVMHIHNKTPKHNCIVTKMSIQMNTLKILT